MQSAPHRVPGDDELIVGFAPALRALTGWRPVFQQRWDTRTGGTVRRVVREDTSNPHMRVIVDVQENLNTRGAQERFEAVKADAEVNFPPGPSRIVGAYSFVNTKKKPSVIGFVRSNLFISIASAGGTKVDIEPWSQWVLDEIDDVDTKNADADLALIHEGGSYESGGLLIRFELPWDRGPWAWYKFKVSDGTLERATASDRLLLRRQGKKTPKVMGWAIEPGRETYAGRLIVVARKSKR